jgi:hypothetical protein
VLLFRVDIITSWNIDRSQQSWHRFCCQTKIPYGWSMYVLSFRVHIITSWNIDRSQQSWHSCSCQTKIPYSGRRCYHFVCTLSSHRETLIGVSSPGTVLIANLKSPIADVGVIISCWNYHHIVNVSIKPIYYLILVRYLWYGTRTLLSVVLLSLSRLFDTPSNHYITVPVCMNQD